MVMDLLLQCVCEGSVLYAKSTLAIAEANDPNVIQRRVEKVITESTREGKYHVDFEVEYMADKLPVYLAGLKTVGYTVDHWDVPSQMCYIWRVSWG